MGAGVYIGFLVVGAVSYLLAVHAVNSPRDYLAVRRALAAGQEIPPEFAADPETPLRPAGASV